MNQYKKGQSNLKDFSALERIEPIDNEIDAIGDIGEVNGMAKEKVI